MQILNVILIGGEIYYSQPALALFAGIDLGVKKFSPIKLILPIKFVIISKNEEQSCVSRITFSSTITRA